MTVMTVAPEVGESGLFSYDDVEKYTHVVFRGKRGWVIDKGEHVLPEVDARHIYIEFEDQDERPSKLNERLVNKFLKERRKLWIDFDNHLDPIRSTDATN